MAGETSLVPAGGYAVVLDADYAGEYDLPAEALRLGVADGRLDTRRYESYCQIIAGDMI
mgnify:CR=1 FL=1